MFHRFLHMVFFNALMGPVPKIFFSISLVSVDFRFITSNNSFPIIYCPIFEGFTEIKALFHISVAKFWLFLFHISYCNKYSMCLASPIQSWLGRLRLLLLQATLSRFFYDIYRGFVDYLFNKIK